MTGVAPPTERRRLAVRGTVQGVGFRPFIYRLATERRLTGWVRNTAAGVEIEVEGEPAALDDFAAALRAERPPLARIETVRSTSAPPAGEVGFRVLRSRARGRAPLPVGADAATCPSCLSELRDARDRRRGYAFINCTDCGPRFTIIRSLPYDRARTTMASFAMCDVCRAEYGDPADRRFHAEPTACPVCGPRLQYQPAPCARRMQAAADPLDEAVAALEAGLVVALKGLGGYQLACDASDARAVRRMRARKSRDAKPFAVMVPDLQAARRLCRVSEVEAALLRGRRAPIVLLRRRAAAPAAASAERPPGPCEEVAPRLDTLGIVLPYTPLHHRLMELYGRPLVLTSGNRSGEPIAAGDDEARERLGAVADGFLLHDRDIASRYDDSVVRVVGGEALVLRRARGYAPEPMTLRLRAREPVLGVGAQLKSAFCLVRGRHAFQSQHIGDLDEARTTAAYAATLRLYRRLFRFRPAWVAHDLHPDYASTRFAASFDDDVRRVPVQHHHAHVVSCLAEHGHPGPALGVCFDGTGYGTDGTVWGGELLLADWRRFRRLAHLRHLAMPGGDAAAREPWRMAAAALVAAHGPEADRLADDLLDAVPATRRGPVLAMARRGVNAPLTSSVGRLFDAVAALAGVCRVNHYEGQAAMELEAAVDDAERGGYPLPLDGEGVWDAAPLVAAVVSDVRRGVHVGRIAARFHNAVATAVVEACRRGRDETGVGVVVLSGGCFQNARLTQRTRAGLEAARFEVLTHRLVPPNDGGICVGQAAVAVALQHDSSEES